MEAAQPQFAQDNNNAFQLAENQIKSYQATEQIEQINNQEIGLVANQAAAPPTLGQDDIQNVQVMNQDDKDNAGGDEREAKLYVDVNVANFGIKRIIVYEGDTVESLVADFVKRCPIDEFMIDKLKLLLQQQMDGVLERIEEDDEQKTENSAETDREEAEGAAEGMNGHGSNDFI